MSSNTIARMGLDIGYSNLKLCYGNDIQKPTKIVLPAVAAPISDLLDAQIQDPRNQNLIVLVDDQPEPWVVGTTDVHNYVAPLHEGYTSSNAYKAMFNGTLAHTRATHIQHLVTGLPTVHWQNRQLRMNLQHRMEGEHQIAEGLKVKVDKVTIRPQPFGSLFSYLSQSSKRAERVRNSTVLIVDAGYYSLDWLVCRNAKRVAEASGTSDQAFSIIVNAVSAELLSEHGLNISLEELKKVIDENLPLTHKGQTLPISKILADARSKVTNKAIDNILNKVRIEHNRIQMVLITGGAASYYHEALTNEFRGLETILVEQPVTANAYGFFLTAS